MAVKVKKKKKKIWYKVVASKEFNNAFIGEVPSFEPKSLIGKCMNVNLMNLMRIPKKQNVNVKFKIVNVTEKNAITDLVNYELSNSYVKRVVRKRKSKLDDSFVLESKDKVKFRVKPLIITRNKVQKGVLTAMRADLKKLIGRYITEKSFSAFIGDVLSGRIQMDLKKKLSKVYPIATFELKTVKRL